MGSAISKASQTWNTVRRIQKINDQVSQKLSESPGIPIPSSSTPYWADPISEISDYRSADLVPEHADIIIIGSGITGTAIARTLLEEYDGLEPKSIVMLDARAACYGATARNGGHINPPLYIDYVELKEALGTEMAKKIIRFRLKHLPTLLTIAGEEGLLTQSQCRKVDAFDVYSEKELFEAVKKDLAVYRADLPAESTKFRVVESKEELQALQLSPRAVGCIVTTAGAVHPYRLVTGILSRLICDFKEFKLFTHTACTSIGAVGSDYAVHTTRGTIKTSIIIHATNAWSSHLLPGLRRKIVPARAEMSAQRPGRELGKSGGHDWTGTRSFVFYTGPDRTRFDYLTQLPRTSPDSAQTNSMNPCGELMFGGGFNHGGIAEPGMIDSIGNVDDSASNFGVMSFLSGALGLYFQNHWGRESDGRDETTQDQFQWDRGRVKGLWSGILSISADLQPWVGRLPETITKRQIQNKDSTTPSGEWISAGYSGEGMSHAWMCGTALAQMILDGFGHSARERKKTSYLDDHWSDWLPDVFLVTKQRWRAAKIDWIFGM